MTNTQWYYADTQRVQHGPVSADELLAAFRANKFSPSSLVWREGYPDWKAFSQCAAELGLDHEQLYPNQSAALNTRADSFNANSQAVVDASNPYAAPSARVEHGAVAMDGSEIVYAGFWKRFAAIFIDNLILGIAAYAIWLPLLFLVGFGGAISNPDASNDPSPLQLFVTMLLYVIQPVLSFFYYCKLESGSAQASLGKQIVGIKVTTLDGQRMTFSNAAIRWLCTIASYMTLYIGFIMAGFTERKQALHDLMASTLVVDKYAFTTQAHRQNRDLGGCATAIIVLMGGFMLIAVLGIVLAIAIPAFQSASS